MSTTRRAWKAGEHASGWTPVREDRPPSDFPRVMALAESDETAELIVRAVNCHDELVEALQAADQTLHYRGPNGEWSISYRQWEETCSKVTAAVGLSPSVNDRSALVEAHAGMRAHLIELHRWLAAPHPDSPGAFAEAQKIVRWNADQSDRRLHSAEIIVDTLEAIVDCYGMGASPEKFVANVHDFIMDARRLLRSDRGGVA